MRKQLIIWGLLILPIMASAQYFGRNKPRYKSQDFNVKETEHFDVYYYSKNKESVDWMAQESELWYDFFSDILFHEISIKNPLIVYNTHGDFQQTNAISSTIGVGTGGVTEGFKNRVVMPLTFTNQQTHQVLGHELVHAFQFNMVLTAEGGSIQNMGNLPLWLVEGMAEYLSLGRVDPFTAMWMRNTILKDDVPTIKEMAHPKYFPYRYGQTLWSFLAGKYGDTAMSPMLKYSAFFGVEAAIDSLFRIDMEDLSVEWDSTLRNHFEPHLRDKKESKFGKTILSGKNSGKINVSPSISPNGKYLVFLSEKDLFSTDLFLAEARTGNIVRKLSSLVKDGDLDAYNYLESAGAWSPNSKEFAFIAFSKGINRLIIKNIENGKTIASKAIPGIEAFSTPTWSPDGKEIVMTGSIEGQTDLFSYNIKRDRVRQLTDDRYSEIQPDFSKDGSQLVFSYDKRSLDEGRTFGRWSFDLAIMDYESTDIKVLDIFHTADNLNPNYDHEGNIYFMSDRDGYRNLYKYDVTTDKVYHMTDYLTGISGISRYSPMISSSEDVDRVVFSYYGKEGYNIISAKSTQLLNEEVDKSKVDFSAGMLPNPKSSGSKEIVTDFHENIDDLEYVSSEEFRTKPYKPQFKLDYVGGGGGVGVGNNLYSNQIGLQGGVDMLFGDMLGNNQLFAQVALNGTIYDMGGQVNYINKKNPIAWGLGISHIPQVTGFRNAYRGNLEDEDGNTLLDESGNTIPTITDELNLIRIFNQSFGAFAQLPFSTKLRLEAGANVGHQGFRWDVTKNFYTSDGLFRYNNRPITNKLDTPDELTFNQFYTVKKGLTGGANIALVGDNSSFGLTAPLTGQRFRLSAEYSYGVNAYYGFLADYRKYHKTGPVTFAWRGLGYLRYETNVSSLYPLFVGQMGFVRGYDNYFSNGFNDVLSDVNLSQLLGSKMALTSFEIRLPFTGPRQLAVIPSRTFFTDINLFFDAGIAFDNFSDIGDDTLPSGPELAMSAGFSARINLFGAMIIEPYWAYPLQKESRLIFGLNLVPGW